MILDSLVPLITLVALGFLSQKKQWVINSTITDISKITFSYLFPIFLFSNIARVPLNDVLSVAVFTSFYGAVLLTYLLSFIVCLLTQSKHVSPGVFALNSTYSNTIIIGLPFLINLYSSEVAAFVFMIISVHSAILFGLTGALHSMKSSGSFNGVQFLKNLIKNPLLIGIFLGFAVNLLTLPLPNTFYKTCELITSPALALALFILGANLYQYRISGNYKVIILASLIKLIILPLITLVLSRYVFALDTMLVTILVVLTACPIGVNAYIIACQQKSGEKIVASSVVLTTLLSALTLPSWVYIISG